MEVVPYAGPTRAHAPPEQAPEVPEFQRPIHDAIRQHIFHQPQGSKAWQLMPELPTASEILVSREDAEDVPQNYIDTAWPSKNNYLETQYRILRREGTEALRIAVNKYKSNPAARDNEDMCIYTKVRVLGYNMTKIGPFCRISFSPERAQKKIVWQQSLRLRSGSVVAISTKRDNFQTKCWMATVAQRPYRDGLDRAPPEIEIIWGSTDEYVVDPEMELIMVEARSGYYESIRHTLVGLQMAADEESSLFKYVVDGDKSDALASFIQEKPILDLSPCLLPNTDPETMQWLRKYDVRGDPPSVEAHTSLDTTQTLALYRMITKELCIVQGPPGTGKTFTSVEALKVILANQGRSDPPIIVAAQTNHALDQLLTLCLDAGANIARVGGRTESERIEEYTMYNLRQKYGSGMDPRLKDLDKRRDNACHALRALSGTIFNDSLLRPEELLRTGVITQAQYDSLVDDEMEQTAKHQGHGPFSLWISGECIETSVIRNKYCDKELAGDDEEFNPEEYEFEDDFENIVDDDEKDRYFGKFLPFGYMWTGKEPAHLSSWHKRAARELEKRDLYAIPKNVRGAVYQLLFERFIAALKPEFAKLFAEHITCCKEARAIRALRDHTVIKHLRVNIVGCTTTGLTKYRGFLASLGAKTILIEEAAETRESNISSALYPSVQQLILVGDHLQLAPFSNTRWLGQKPYYLDLSMFQRMVENLQINYIMLDKQRRMAPEIRAVVDHFYDGLQDHEVAKRREPVPGMGDRRTWLFGHQWEDSVDANHSRYNTEEATMIVHFFSYLVSNGVKPSQITVLTFYKAQRRTILKKLKLDASLSTIVDPFQVHTVDSYQGEENDIVLLSLVRSPPASSDYKVGFLDNRNRVIVSISRARRGFYVFGNVVNAVNASRASQAIWSPIANAFIEQKRYDDKRGLPLQCQPHGKTVWVKNTSQWANNPRGCDQRCTFVRECGHKCGFPCHTKPHDKILCTQMCQKMLPCGHKCEIFCKEPCNCLCPTFKAMKAQNEARQRQGEEEMHMELEELLHAEAGVIRQPTVTSSKMTKLIEARRPDVQEPRLAARQGNVSGTDTQNQRRLVPLAGDRTDPITNGIHRLPMQFAKPPRQGAGPIIHRAPPSYPKQNGKVAGAPGRSHAQGRFESSEGRATAFQKFAQNIDTHNMEDTQALRAYLATTAGKEPKIVEIYRPVTLVDGRRESPLSSSPEKSDPTHRVPQSTTGQPTRTIIPSEPELADALLAEAGLCASGPGVDGANQEKKLAATSPDIGPMIGTLTDLKTKSGPVPKAVSPSLPSADSADARNEKTRTTISEAEPITPVNIGADSAAMTAAPTQEPTDAGKGSDVLDLGRLVASSTVVQDGAGATNGQAIHAEARISSPACLDLLDHPINGALPATDQRPMHGRTDADGYSGLDTWLATIAMSGKGHSEEKSNGAGASATAVTKPNGGKGEDAGDLLIFL